jgi:hypothetical protein
LASDKDELVALLSIGTNKPFLFAGVTLI